MRRAYGLATALLIMTCAARCADRPNILFIAVDDLRPELGCYGMDYIKSPNIDRLAKAGVVFDRAYCQQAVCSPSRSSLMTGTRPDTTRVWDLQTHFRTALPDVATLGQHFKQNGYIVQGMGKIFHGGYDDPPTWSVPWQSGDPAVIYALKENREKGAEKKSGPTPEKGSGKPKKSKRGPAYESADVPDNTYRDGRVADLAIAALGEMKARPDPFFLAVGFSKPHLPFVAPKKYWDLYDPATIRLADNKFRPKGAPEYAILPGGELRAYRDIPDGSLPDDLARRLKHGYYAAISYMDAQLGRVLDELEHLGLRDNTIIVLWGDHGWKLGEHDAWCKHSNCENDTHSTLILSAPRMKAAGARTKALVEFVDIYPTLTELAGLPLPPHLEGISFRPVLDEPGRQWKSAAFSQYPRKTEDGQLMGYSIRTDRHRFTRWVYSDDPTKVAGVELYDHANDPQENESVAAKPENAALVAELTAQLNAGWRGALPKGTMPAASQGGRP